jgi:hypothetical protein
VVGFPETGFFLPMVLQAAAEEDDEDELVILCVPTEPLPKTFLGGAAFFFEDKYFVFPSSLSLAQRRECSSSVSNQHLDK